MKKYSNEMFEFVKANIKGTRIYQMAELVNQKFGINITENQMKSYCSNNKLTNGLFHKSEGLRPKYIFSSEQMEFIHENYINKGNQELADLLNKKFNTSYTRLQIKRYKNSKHLDSGLTGYFQKGHVSANKGMQMSAEQYKKCKATMFKKGHIPHNHKPVGSERVETKDGYTLIKTGEPNKWELKHKVIWEQANGPVPKGHIITFLDGNRKNFSLDNLACISLEENAVLNHMKLRGNKATTEIAINIARIKTKISKLKQKG